MQSSSDFQRYFLAIIPPEPVYSEAQVLKEYFKNTFGSKASLNSPPHITLHMPFRWKEKKELILIEKLKDFGQLQAAFQLSLHRFNAFPPRVIYLDVETNSQLVVLQKELERFCKRSFQLFNANRLDQPFRPHLTLAFRDLKKETFGQAWNEFKNREYKANWLVESIYLLKHNGSVWEKHAQVALKKTIY
ncbi:RNA 2',3'-cyclic phosphodiesterase [Chryseotalea sanaruensis]|uniref:RNA 2',3'-cyclic phosphodiesterase n=1 Tax=Chryseotalea sanaruensis TaxID=2482724 RepID=A0A401U893_9BACT|nr:2'-5' RNA ligase family protein [Chryseotalea sanaruensis]GCC51097.1 RNA 2',3'-cyclic phosphodiesterase [Chryseotalea sanaruensis]